MSSQADKLRKARTQMVLDQPFFGFLACYLEPRATPDTQSLATDGRALLYNPAFVEAAGMDEIRFVMAHVIQHLALDHFGRRYARQEKIWDLASDFAANQVLVSYGMTPPARLPVAYDPAFKGKTAEEIYSLLVNDPSRCDVPRFDDHEDFEPLPDEEKKEWIERVVRVTTLLKQQGRLPGGLEQDVRKLLEPRVNWRRVLYRFLLQTAKFDYSYARCNRRYVAQGLYVPGLQSERIENLVLALDTSGSISDEQIREFLSEVNSIALQFQISWKLITCDCEVQDVVDVEQGFDPSRLAIRGRGGTSFRPVFDWVQRSGVTPCALVYLTDGDGEFPDRAPHYPVLWALTQPHAVPFGESLTISSQPTAHG